jgi:hypothetical protein
MKRKLTGLENVQIRRERQESGRKDRAKRRI